MPDLLSVSGVAAAGLGRGGANRSPSPGGGGGRRAVEGKDEEGQSYIEMEVGSSVTTT